MSLLNNPFFVQSAVLGLLEPHTGFLISLLGEDEAGISSSLLVISGRCSEDIFFLKGSNTVLSETQTLVRVKMLTISLSERKRANSGSLSK